MKKNNFILVVTVSLFFAAMSLWTIVADTPNYSDSERRVLASMPAFDVDDILTGDYAEDFDRYSTDRFPERDAWRTIKAYTAHALCQKDHHGIYTADGHLSKLEYPMHPKMLDRAIAIFDKVYDNYLENSRVYLAVIPDKNRYLAPQSGHLSMDYDAFSAYMADGCNFAKYIEIADLLDASDYYTTDTHWRQEKIFDVADRLTLAMGASDQANQRESYTIESLDIPFYGVYSGQSALHPQPDTIKYLTSDTLHQATTKGAAGVYDFDKAKGKDPYELFLSGNQPLITLTNPNATTGRRLVLFRDSFGSSLAPLLLENYREIVLVDLRYMPVDQLESQVAFDHADVLFIYSTMMLNQSTALKS